MLITKLAGGLELTVQESHVYKGLTTAKLTRDIPKTEIRLITKLVGGFVNGELYESDGEFNESIERLKDNLEGLIRQLRRSFN